MKSTVDTTPIFADAIADLLKIISGPPAQRPPLESIARRMSETIREGERGLFCDWIEADLRHASQTLQAAAR